MFWRGKQKTNELTGLGLNQSTLPLTSASEQPDAHRPRESEQHRQIGQLIDQWDLGPYNRNAERVVGYGPAAIHPLMMRLQPGHPKLESALYVLSKVLKKFRDQRLVPMLIELIRFDHASMVASCIENDVNRDTKFASKRSFRLLDCAIVATECLGDSGDRSVVSVLKEFKESLISESVRLSGVRKQKRAQGGGDYFNGPEQILEREISRALEEIDCALIKLGEHELIPKMKSRYISESRVVETLSQVGTPAIPEVLKWLANKSYGRACSVLAEIGNDTCIRPLIKVFSNDYNEGKEEAARALARITERCATAMSEIDLRLIASQRDPYITWTSREDSDIHVSDKVNLSSARSGANRELARRGLAG